VTLTNPFGVRRGPASRTDAQVSGVVLSAEGRPVQNQAVGLIAAVNATRHDKQIPHVSVRTGRDGGFTFAFIPPGSYLVGVNLRNPPRGSRVDHRSSYPGVPDWSRAIVVTITAGSRVQLSPYRLPRLPPVTNRQVRQPSSAGAIGATPAPQVRLV
jgi:hypothetical protein